MDHAEARCLCRSLSLILFTACSKWTITISGLEGLSCIFNFCRVIRNLAFTRWDHEHYKCLVFASPRSQSNRTASAACLCRLEFLSAWRRWARCFKPNAQNISLSRTTTGQEDHGVVSAQYGVEWIRSVTPLWRLPLELPRSVFGAHISLAEPHGFI